MSISIATKNQDNSFENFDSKETEKYYKKFQNKVFVIKYGGSALQSEGLMKHFLDSVAKLHHKGIKIILVHGGGPILSQKMKENNLQVTFQNGLRISTPETIHLAIEVFSQINQKICRFLSKFSCNTQPFPRGEIISASLIDPQNFQNRVGVVQKIETKYFDFDKIPVISSLGIEKNSRNDPPEKKRILNLNADHLTVALCHSLKVRKLIYISDVNGIYRESNNPSSKIDHITETEIRELMKKGIIHGGMQVKVETAIEALKSGVKKVHFINGSIENSLLHEVLTNKGIGTEIVHDQ